MLLLLLLLLRLVPLLLFSLYCYFKLFDKMFVALLLFQTDYDHFTALHFTSYYSLWCNRYTYTVFHAAHNTCTKDSYNVKVLKSVLLDICSRCLSLSIGCAHSSFSFASFAVDIVFVCLTLKIRYCVAEGRILVEKSINFLLNEFNSKITSNA